MIGRLRGTLISKQPPWLVVEVGGVGYELEAPMSTIYDLPGLGKEVILLTHYAQKEDSVSLYGFLGEAERALFRNLLKVSGIGAKIALAVLSGVSTNDFARLVHAGDVVALTKIPGIGKKTAERIVVELLDKIGTAGALEAASARHGLSPDDQKINDATLALMALGFKQNEAHDAVRAAQAMLGAAATIEQLMRACLKKN